MREERMIELADKRTDMENEDKKTGDRNTTVRSQWYVVVPICSSNLQYGWDWIKQVKS